MNKGTKQAAPATPLPWNIEMKGKLGWGIVVQAVSEAYARKRVDQLRLEGFEARVVQITNPVNA